jgi:hypothetical protein
MFVTKYLIEVWGITLDQIHSVFGSALVATAAALIKVVLPWLLQNRFEKSRSGMQVASALWISHPDVWRKARMARLTATIRRRFRGWGTRTPNDAGSGGVATGALFIWNAGSEGIGESDFVPGESLSIKANDRGLLSFNLVYQSDATLIDIDSAVHTGLGLRSNLPWPKVRLLSMPPKH